MLRKKYRALRNLALRQSSDPTNPKYNQWFEWQEGEIFEAPSHMRVDVMLANGKIEEVKRG